jgi:hypothetical protein
LVICSDGLWFFGLFLVDVKYSIGICGATMRLNEITRPDTQKNADEILRNAGYKRLAFGAFGAVYEKGNRVIKTFSSIDTAYLKFVKMVKQSNYNPHFPMFYGNTIKINNDYYAVKQENLKEYRGDPTAIRYYIQYLISGMKIGYPSHYEEIEEIEYDYPRFKEACQMIADLIKSNPEMKLDVKKDNIMTRNRTIVFVDPVAHMQYSDDELENLPNIGSWDDSVKQKFSQEDEELYRQLKA